MFTGQTRKEGESKHTRFHVSVGNTDVWLSGALYRTILILATERSSTQWTPAIYINNNIRNIPRSVYRLRGELKKCGITESIIQSDGKCNWLLKIPSCDIEYDFDRLNRVVDSDIKNNLKNLRDKLDDNRNSRRTKT